MIKITRPQPRDIFPRPRLFEQLTEMRQSPVIWISAPAGSGKTSLITSYIEHHNLPCLWYQLDESDGDPATFFYYMGQAAGKLSPKRQKQMPLLTPEYLRGIPTFTLRYFEKLYGGLKPSSLVVYDNYQETSEEAPFQEVMAIALSMIPNGVNTIIISRTDPPPRMVRLKANGRLARLGWEEIRLTQEEATAMIKGRFADTCPEEMVEKIYHFSGGWAAGLVLVSETIRKEKLAPCMVGHCTADETFEYFAAEIFDSLDPETKTFLATTSFFPKMTAAMAEKLTGNPSSAALLRGMCRKNYFITRSLDAEPIYEYHPLYRHFLLSRGKAILLPGTLSQVRRSAALILEEAGMTEAAIMLHKDGADWDMMARIILAHAPEMLKQGRYHPLQRWLERLPGGMLETAPWLLYWKGMSAIPIAPAEATPILEKAFSLFQTSGDMLGAMLAASGVIYSIAYKFNDFSTLEHWYTVLNNLASEVGKFPSEEIEATVISSLLLALTMLEKCTDEAKTWEDRALNIPESENTIHMKAQVLHLLFWSRLSNRSAPEALALLQELKRISRRPGAEPLFSITVQTSEVQYYLITGLHDKLMDAAIKGLALADKTGIHLEDMWFYAHVVTSFLSRMDIRGAQTWLDKILPMAASWPNWASALYHLQLMRLAFLRKEYGQALAEGRLSLDFATKSGSPFAIAGVQGLLAQLLLIMGKREKALAYLEPFRSYAVQKNSSLGIHALLLYDAQFAFAEGNEPKGLLLLGKALTMAREHGWLVYVFDHPPVTIQLCEKALEAGIEVAHVQEIIRRRRFAPDKAPVHIEAWPWAVKVYTLGRFGIVRNDDPIRFSGKAKQMPLRLLKVLIALGGREIPEYAISDLLWPDAEGDMAHQSFEINLHRLRKLLDLPEALRLSDGKVTLDNRYCWVDAWAFERLIGQADEAKKQGCRDRAMDLIKKAVGLYQGSFLAGEPEDPWVVSSSERLRSKLLQSILWLGRRLEETGDWETATVHYEKCLAIDDLVEEIYCRLMICHNRAGRNAEAWSTYQRCSKTLASVLGIRPSSETEAIRSALFSEKG